MHRPSNEGRLMFWYSFLRINHRNCLPPEKNNRWQQTYVKPEIVLELNYGHQSICPRSHEGSVQFSILSLMVANDRCPGSSMKQHKHTGRGIFPVETVWLSAICGSGTSSERGTSDVSEEEIFLRHIDAIRAPLLITGQHILFFYHWLHRFSSSSQGDMPSGPPPSFSQTSGSPSAQNRAGKLHLPAVCWESTRYYSPLAVRPQKSGTWKLTTYHSSHGVKKCRFTIFVLSY